MKLSYSTLLTALLGGVALASEHPVSQTPSVFARTAKIVVGCHIRIIPNQL